MMSAAVRFKMLNVRYALAHWKRSLSCVVAVTIGTALLVAIAGIYGSLTKSVATMSEDLYGKAAFEVTGAADSGLPESLVASCESRRRGRRGADSKGHVNAPRSGTTLLGSALTSGAGQPGGQRAGAAGRTATNRTDRRPTARSPAPAWELRPGGTVEVDGPASKSCSSRKAISPRSTTPAITSSSHYRWRSSSCQAGPGEFGLHRGQARCRSRGVERRAGAGGRPPSGCRRATVPGGPDRQLRLADRDTCFWSVPSRSWWQCSSCSTP